MGTGIYLQSDFIEDYDQHLHDPMGKIVWKRLSRGGRNRREIFKLLYQYIKSTKSRYPNVPPNGTVQELYDKYEEREIDGKWNATWDHTGICSSFSELVIYKDEMAHRGEGKEIIYVEDAIRECPDAFASVLLRNNQNYSISYRELFIGNEMHKLTYVSLTDSWRSNCGHVVITYEGSEICSQYDHVLFTRKHGTDIKSPMFAFDYIEIPVASSQFPDGVPRKFYVDFNEAPGLPEEVVINCFGDKRRGDLVPFEEIVSNEKIVEKIKNSLKSDK